MWAYIVFARTFLLHLLHTAKTQKKITPFLNEKTQKKSEERIFAAATLPCVC